MKKLYFTILSALFCLGANAQTLTATNHGPVLGESFTKRQCDSTGISPGGSGSAQTWNFSAMNTRTYEPNVNYSVVSVASTGSASTYPSAGVAVASGTNNSFYSFPTTRFDYYGGNLRIGTYDIILTYTSLPATLVNYPMSLNASITNTTAGNCSALGQNGTFTGNNNSIADATGTLSLAGRTFSNVIRVVNSQTLNASVVIAVLVNQKVYDYYDPTVSKSPILSIATASITSLAGNATQTVVTVNGNYKFVGITENTKEISDLNLYPNPAKTNFTLSFTNANAENASYEIMNAIGQTVRKENIDSDKGIVKHNINIENLESGIYFVKTMLGNSSSVKKITIQ